MSFKRDICCFDFRSNFLYSISFLINIGKEMSLPGFRTFLQFGTVKIVVFLFPKDMLYGYRSRNSMVSHCLYICECVKFKYEFIFQVAQKEIASQTD